MTETPKHNDPMYVQGYWVELAKSRFAGGVSAEAHNWEGGLGAVYNEQRLGLTGYVQYSLPFIHGRFQVDLLSDNTWLPQFIVGAPIKIQDFKLEPHILWPIEENTSPRLGLRVQYQF